MNIIEKKLSEIKPYENNPRKNDEAVKYVAESIKQFGFKVPIVIDRDGVIVCGHTRYKAAKRLKMDSVPCIMADDLTDEQIKAYRLADNKVAELADWDEDKLKAEINEIFSFDMVDFGFAADEATKINEDKVPSVEETKHETQKGDIWILGDHVLMCGDSTNSDDVKKLMNDTKADMVLTDPPYNVDYGERVKVQKKFGHKYARQKSDIKNDKIKDFYDFLTKVFSNMKAYLKEGSGFYVCYSSSEGLNFEKALKDCGLKVRQQLIWCKRKMVLGLNDYQFEHEPILYGWNDGAAHKFYGTKKNKTLLQEDFPVEIGMDLDGETLINVHIGKKRVILKAPSVEVLDVDDVSTLIFVDNATKNKVHPTMKPVTLCAKLIKNSSKRGETVLDLFGGSGSTLIACEKLGRKCRMMEFEPQYCDVIKKRWEEETGRKGVKVNGL